MLVPTKGLSLDAVATPVLIVDKDMMFRNIGTMMQRYKESPVSIRPHMKTCKSPEIARFCLYAGAQGICVVKTSEAWVMAESGITDILITSPVGHPTTAQWCAELIAKVSDVKIVVDSEAGAQMLSEALKGLETKADVLIDVNVGQNRTGVQPSKAVALADFVAGLGNLNIVGCQGYEGHLQFLPMDERKEKSAAAMEMLVLAANSMRKNHKITVVTTGGTGTSTLCAATTGITEVQPGSFIFMDVKYRDSLGDDAFGTALQVMSTVISKPLPELATIDVGWKSVSTEYGMPEPVLKDCVYTPAGDEHGTLSGAGAADLSVGDRVMLIPSHIDTTVVLHEFYVVMQGKLVSEVWPIATRGRVQ
jgi:D-serine deaminase-like pyridoxal phosphate-dependent protein